MSRPLIVRHHAPFFADAGSPAALRLFAMMAEGCLPLLDRWRALDAAGAPSHFTAALSPTLLEHWADPELCAAFGAWLEDEASAASGERATRLKAARALYVRLDGDLLAEYRRLWTKGHVELITLPATDAPL
ncbi:MAG: hypothetical protein KC620_26325, partial [Myxococcales bacterium]|nr:hypothetical protein [Myxococcales bacterium]